MVVKLAEKTEKEITYTLHEYDHRFDAGLSAMWNESDDQWPGTFNDGVPQTEERIAEWMDRLEARVQYVVVEDLSGKVVGYGDLWEEKSRPGSCYVALLNVHPDHQGRSLARRMLVEMVEWATENGMGRITIGTWPSNIKAMPLYKKTGFFWIPDTNVYMENYVPAVRQLSLARSYFERYDWYRTYDRELLQVEDDMRHPKTGQMKVFVLGWRADSESLIGVFDRNAQALTGIVTPELEVFARTGDSDPGQLVRYPFEWELLNKGSTPRSIALKADGDDGITLEFQRAFTLQPGEHKLLKSTFMVKADAPKFQIENHDMPTPGVHTQLLIDGEELNLSTGLRYRPPVEFSLHPEVVSLLPGTPQTVHVQLKNTVKQPLKGEVVLELPDGLQADWTTHVYKLKSEGFFGVPVVLMAERAGHYALSVRATFQDEGADQQTHPQLLSLIALEPGGWGAGLAEETLILENDNFRIICKAKGGVATVWNKTLQRQQATLMEELGPPFVPWDLAEQTYDLELQRTPVGARANLSVRSTRFPGVVVEREIVLTAAPLIHIRGRVFNKSNEPVTGLQLRPRVRFARWENGFFTVPLQAGIVHEHGAQFGNSHGDMPEKPADYREGWTAHEEVGQVLGVFWKTDHVEKIQGEWGNRFFYLSVNALESGESQQLAPLYLYAGPGDWRTVRQTWLRLGGGAYPQLPDAPLPDARAATVISLDPAPLVTLDDTLRVELKTHTTREVNISGVARVQTPIGWRAVPDEVAVEGVAHKTPATIPVTLTTEQNEVGSWEGQLNLETTTFDLRRPFSLIRLGRSDQIVQVADTHRAGQTIWQINNGHTKWEIAPDFSACVIGWFEQAGVGAPETNQLFTSFPETGEISWIKPWYGGLRPILHEVSGGESEGDGWPGKLHDEKFSAAPLPAVDGRDLPWSGLRLVAELDRKIFRGLHAEIDYLTLPGSNVLKVVYRLHNHTGIFRDAEPGLMAYFQIDGTHTNGVLHTQDYQRKRTSLSSWGVVDGWAAVQNPETGRTMVMVNARGWQRVQTMDLGKWGAHFNCYETIHVPPQSAYEMVVYLALAESLEGAKRYDALRAIA